jgi:RNA polymerase sigma-70 factor (ECF subfamily)
MDVPDKSQITQWLAELAERGERGTVDQLMDALYPELRRLAHKVFLRLVDQTRVDWEGRSHFLAIAAKVMRRVLIDHARGRARQRRQGCRKITGLDSEVLPAEFTQAELLEVNEALDKLAAMDARQAQVVEMRFFGGMTIKEIAEALGVSKRTIEADWTHAKAWLRLVLAGGTEP